MLSNEPRKVCVEPCGQLAGCGRRCRQFPVLEVELDEHPKEPERRERRRGGEPAGIGKVPGRAPRVGDDAQGGIKREVAHLVPGPAQVLVGGERRVVVKHLDGGGPVGPRRVEGLPGQDEGEEEGGRQEGRRPGEARSALRAANGGGHRLNLPSRRASSLRPAVS